MSRYICIHGHFYQPPRENPWLDFIEVQKSAAPFHDWNERIDAECYLPNSAARILDEDKNIVDIVNNYSRISFNFGPTLLSWMEKNSPEVYQAVLEADRESRDRFSGHGPALAQAYGHMIMPLATARDKWTQIVWGIRDFEHRFGRRPSGMWLPETAVDTETLEILAEQNIGFTILAPHQARQVRRLGQAGWTKVGRRRLDTTRPYLCPLPSGRTISLFFYDGPLSHAVAFGGLLKSGTAFALKMKSGFSPDDDRPQLVHVATDGETYGHHHRFGDMALAYCLREIESDAEVSLTIYGEYLERYPPTHEVRIRENTSWSCEHGLKRWQENCGCRVGRNPGWTQEWRLPFRTAMDWLRESLAELYESRMKKWTPDPWKVRDEYISLVLDRSRENAQAFFLEHLGHEVSSGEMTEALKLLEVQRNGMMMYTSCGWFFDEISGIESVQGMLYASRAIQLAGEVDGRNRGGRFRELLEKAPSNDHDLGNGAVVYDEFVRPAFVDIYRLGAHYAAWSLYDETPPVLDIGPFRITRDRFENKDSWGERRVLGRALLESRLVWEKTLLEYAALSINGDDFIAGVCTPQDAGESGCLGEQIAKALFEEDDQEFLRAVKDLFGIRTYSLSDLIPDERRRLLDKILRTSVADLESSFGKILKSRPRMLGALKAEGIPLPEGLDSALGFLLNVEIRRMLEGEALDLKRLKELAGDFTLQSLRPDRKMLGGAVSRFCFSTLSRLEKDPASRGDWERLEGVLSILENFNLEIDLWMSQNVFFRICRRLQGKGAAAPKRNEIPVGRDLLDSLQNRLKVKCL